MNITHSLHARPSAGDALRRGWTVFWCSASPFVRWSVLSCFAPFAAIDLWRGHMPSPYLLAMFLWWLWVPQIAVLQRDARLERMPGLAKGVPVALLLALIPLVAGFALLAKLSTLGYFVAICALGVSVMLSPLSGLRWVMLAFLTCSFGDSLAQKFFDVPLFAPALKALVTTIESSFALSLVALTVVLALAAWRWHRFIGLSELVPTSGLNTPLVLQGRMKHLDQDPLDGLMTGISFGLLAGVFRTRPAAMSADPIAAMRTLCGPLFVPLNKMQYAMRFVAGAAVLMMVLAVVVERSLFSGLIAGALSLAMGMVLMPYLLRIGQMMHTPSGDLAELALLPGWGAGENAKRMLLHGFWLTFGPEFLTMVLLLAPLPFVHWYAGNMPLSIALGYLATIGMLQTAIACAIVLMLNQDTWATVMRIGILPLTVLCAMVSGLVFSDPNPFWQGILTGMLVLSVLLWALIAVLMRKALRRYHARPHPFLSQ